MENKLEKYFKYALGENVYVNNKVVLSEGTTKEHRNKYSGLIELPNKLTEVELFDVRGASSRGSTTVTVKLKCKVQGVETQYYLNGSEYLALLELPGIRMTNKKFDNDFVLLHKKGVLESKLFPYDDELLSVFKEKRAEYKNKKELEKEKQKQRVKETRKKLRALTEPTLIKIYDKGTMYERYAFYLGFKYVTDYKYDVLGIYDEEGIRTRKKDLIYLCKWNINNKYVTDPYEYLTLHTIDFNKVIVGEVYEGVTLNLDEMDKVMTNMLDYIENYYGNSFYSHLPQSIQRIPVHMSISDNKDDSVSKWKETINKMIEKRGKNLAEDTFCYYNVGTL